MKKLISFIFLFFVSLFAFGQLAVTPTPNSIQVINQLQGGGVQISNLHIYCDSTAYGLFQGTSELPLTSGLAITTGHVADIIGNADTVNANSCLLHDNLGGWTELTNYQPTSTATFDYCRIDFTIVSIGDTLKTGFVFGSEEYPIGRKNDRAGIFISGLNPAGGNYDTVELTMIGSNPIPLCANNVNETCWQAYYLPNYVPAGQYFSYDGSTIYLQRKIAVVPNQPYYISLSVADMDDCDYDSGLFIDGFSSDSLLLNVTDNKTLPDLNIFPNPTAGLTSIYWNQNQQPIKVVLTNSVGQVLNEIIPSENNIAIDMSFYPSGIYFVRFDTNKGTTYRKVIRK